jgi:hypothetical protein
MQTSQTLSSKMSRTKKRLSDSIINESVLLTLAVCGLLLFLSYSIRVISVGGVYGLISLDIPVAQLPIEDKGLHTFRETTANTISPQTLAIGITTSEMIFGDMNSFSNERDDVRNKFIIPHISGSPQTDSLLRQVEQWSDERARKKSIRPDGLVVVVPDPEVPVAVVAGVVESLKQAKKFSHVMIGGGLL